MPAIKPPPPTGDEDGVDFVAGTLAQDLHADGALAGDHVRIVEGMDERELPLARQHQRMLVGLIVVIAVQHHLAAEDRSPPAL